MFRNNPLGFVISVLLIAVAVWIIILLIWYVKSRSEKLTITTEELCYEKGILSKSRSELQFMILGFAGFFVIFWLLIAWIF